MSFLDQIRKFNNDKLKHTTTVVRENPFVDDTPINDPTPEKEEIKEFYETTFEELDRKVKEVATLIKQSKHIVAYTGAGISTSTGIPDYRGPQGAWTLMEKGLRATGKPIESANPSFAHMGLTKMHSKALVKHVVSTNLDGLHRRADLPRAALSSLHGDAYEERCADCKTKFFRDFDCTKHGCRKDHKTMRQCEKCGGDLLDSIINFGENLPTEEFDTAYKHSMEADLTLVFGTSMLVAPACKLPLICPKKHKGHMVICNKQKTPYDHLAAVRIFGDVDDMFVLLMKELGLEVDKETSQGLPVFGPTVEHIQKKIHNFVQQEKSTTQPLPKDIKASSLEVDKLKQQVSALGLGAAFSGKSDAKRFISNCNTAAPIVLDDLKKQTLAYFHNCKSAQFQLRGECAKIILEGCSDMQLDINATVMTGHMEIINCSKLKVGVAGHRIPTMTIDNSSHVTLEFAPSAISTLFINKCMQVFFTALFDHHSEAQQIKCDPAHLAEKWEQEQIRVVCNPKATSPENPHGLMEELVVREGNGYATTAVDKQLRDEQDEKNRLAMWQKMQGMISITSRDDKPVTNNNNNNNSK